MSELDQVFFIGGSKGKFWHGYQEQRYLPAILPKEPIQETATPDEPLSFDSQKYLIQRLNELEGKINRCIQRANSLFDKKKKEFGKYD